MSAPCELQTQSTTPPVGAGSSGRARGSSWRGYTASGWAESGLPDRGSDSITRSAATLIATRRSGPGFEGVTRGEEIAFATKGR
jgi:hypothetical protein